jgi:hypothetical protein
MAIAFDTSTASSSTTISYTCGSSANILVVMAIATNGASITGITYNGTSLTQLTTVTDSGNSTIGYCYYLMNPSTGSAYNIIVSHSGGSGNQKFITSVASYSGVTSAPTLSNTNIDASGAHNTLTTTLTSVPTSSWTVLGGFIDSGAVTLSAGSGSDLRSQANLGGVGSVTAGIFDSNGNVSGSVSMTYTSSSNDPLSSIIIALNGNIVLSVSDTESESESVSMSIPIGPFSVSDTETESDSVVSMKVINYTFSDLPGIIGVSAYKWTTNTLYTAQNQFTVRPALSCQIIDQTFLVNQQMINQTTPPSTPTSIIPGACSDSCVAPDGSLWVVVEDVIGNLRVGQITNGNTLSQWQNIINGTSGTIIANVSTWLPSIVGFTSNENSYQLNASIACSEWIQGYYTLDVYYFKNNTYYEIHHSRSTNSGSTWTADSNAITTSIIVSSFLGFIQLAAGTPVFTPTGSNTGNISCTVFFLQGLGNATSNITYSYGTTGSIGTSFTSGANWTSQYANSGDWNLHSFDVEYVNGTYYLVFSGYHTDLLSTNNSNAVSLTTSSAQSNFIGNFGIYVIQLTQWSEAGGVNGANPIWSEPGSILTFNSNSSTNYNQCLYPAISYDGTYFWLSFRGDFTTSISETQNVTTSLNYYYCRSLDLRNFDYPTQVIDQNGNAITGYANGICRYVLIGNQNGYYYFLGSDALWQFIQNYISADVSNDIISIQIQDQTGGASSLNLTINNASGKWAGPNPTGTNYSAIWKNGSVNKNSLVYLYLGYYTTTGGPEYVPRNIYYIQDITQNTSSTQNDLVIVGQDFNKLLTVTQTAWTYNYQGPDFYFDPFTSTSIANWGASMGSWYQSPIQTASTPTNLSYFGYAPYTQYQPYISSAGSGGSSVDGSFSLNGQTLTVLSGFQITKPSVTLATSFWIPAAGGSGIQTGAEYDFYPLYINSNNYIQVQVIYSGSSTGYFQITTVSNGQSVIQGPGSGSTFSLTPSTWYPIYINCYNYGTVVDVNIGGAVGSGADPANDKASFGTTNTNQNYTVFPTFNVYQFSNGVNPSIAIGTNNNFGNGTTTSSTQANPFFALFANLKFSQYTYSQTLDELTKKLGTLAHVFNYKPEQDLIPNLFQSSQWNSSGTFSLTNRRINLGGNSFALNNANPYSNGQIEFDTKVVTGVTKNFGFDLVLMSQNSGNLTQCYKLRFINSENGPTGANNNIVKCSLLLSSTGYIDSQLFSSIIPDQLSLQTYNNNGNGLNIDLTLWHHYQVMFNKGWFSVWVDHNMVLAWYDNNYTATYSSGYWGFSTVGSTEGNISYQFTSSETLYVQNITFPTFWQQINSFSVNPGDDLGNDIMTNLQTAFGWFFSDLGGRMKLVVLKNSDPTSYYYGDGASSYLLYNTSIDSSDKEYFNQVLVVGDGVSYLATDATAVGSNGILREQVIVNYQITTLQAAMTQANQQLANMQKYGAQPAPEQQINVGSEVFDVVSIVDMSTSNTTGLNGLYRLFTQSFQIDNQSNYSLTLGTGAITSNS